MSHFNLKLSYNQSGELSRLECGNFGPATDDKGHKVDKAPTVDCFVVWPLPPAYTGKYGIATMLGVPLADDCEFIETPIAPMNRYQAAGVT